MRVYRKLLMVALLLLSLLMIPATSSVRSKFPISTPEGTALDWLRTDGKCIVDSEGNIISWRGVNVMDVYVRPRTEEDYKRMASWGVRVVRVPIAWRYIEPEPGIYDLSYIEYIDRELTWGEKYRIYVALDMHQWYWSPHFAFFSNTSGKGYGAPVWLVNGYPDTIDGWLDAITDFWLGKGPNGTQASSLNPSMMDRYVSVWKLLASRYRNTSTIALFDLFNEPPRGRLSHTQHAQYLYSFYYSLISEIRKIDDNHILNYQPTWGWATPFARLLNKSNITFSFNFYSLKNNYDGNLSELESKFLSLWNPIKKWNIPVWISEVGIELFRPNFTLWAENILTILKQYQPSWTWWVYAQSDSPGYSLLYANGTEKTEITSIVKEFLKHPS